MNNEALVDDLNRPHAAYIKKGDKVIVFSFVSEEIWTEPLSDFSMRKNRKDLKAVLVSSLMKKVMDRHKQLLEAVSIKED
jgi:hypothetical protein